MQNHEFQILNIVTNIHKLYNMRGAQQALQLDILD